MCLTDRFSKPVESKLMFGCVDNVSAIPRAWRRNVVLGHLVERVQRDRFDLFFKETLSQDRMMFHKAVKTMAFNVEWA